MRNKMFKLLSGILTTAILAGAVGPIPAKAAVDNGWEAADGKWYWYENGVKQGYNAEDETYRGKEIYDPGSDAWYWLDNVQGGAKAVSKDVYQESLAGNWADRADGTGKWVRYDGDGHMIKGWSTNENGTYYFDPVYGTMAKGYAVIDGNLHYFDKATGVESACSWDGINGWVVVENIDGNCYWYENGVRQGHDPNNSNYRGKEIYDPESDAWYWLDNVDGGKKAVSKDVYQESAAGEWADREDGTGKWVRYDAQGHMIKGWSTNENGTYYFDPIYGTMAKGMATIEGKQYEFDRATGVLIREVTGEDTENGDNTANDNNTDNDNGMENGNNTDNDNGTENDDNTDSGDNTGNDNTTEKYDYAEAVVEELTDNTDYRVEAAKENEEGELILPQNEETSGLKAGDVLVLPATEEWEEGLILKVTEARMENGEVKVQGEVPNDPLEVYESVSIEGTAQADPGGITAAEGVTVRVVEGEGNLKGSLASDSMGLKKETVQLNQTVEYEIKKLNTTVTMEIPEITYDLDYDNTGIKELYIELPNEIVIHTEVSKELSEEAELGTIPFKLPAGFSVEVVVMLVVNVEGTASIEFRFDNKVGVNYENGSVNPIAECTPSHDMELSADAKTGVNLDVGIYFAKGISEKWDEFTDWFKGEEDDDDDIRPIYNVGAQLGIGVGADLQTHTDVKLTCVNLATHLYLDMYVGEGSFIGDTFNLKKTWNIWDEDNTIFKKSLHQENGLFVNACTYKPKVALSSCTVTLSQSSYTYDGTAKKPTVTVKSGSTTIPTTEYTVNYFNNVNVGTATVTITANSSSTKVSGSTAKTFTIKTAVENTEKPVALSSCTVILSQSSYTYDGTAKKPTVTVKSGSTTIPSTEYTVSYSNNVNVGTAMVTITAKSGSTKVSGSATKTFSITDGRVELSSCTVTLSEDSYTYDGKAKEPTVTVKNGSTAIPSVEYTVSYSNNVNVGTATVMITAKSSSVEVSGSVMKTFTIGKISQTLSVEVGEKELFVDDTTTITAEGVGTISFESSDTDVVTVDSDGLVTAMAEGTADITVTAAGDEHYATASAIITITVKKVKYHGQNGNVIWTISEDGELRVTGTCDESGLLPTDWDSYKEEITSVYIAVEGVKSLDSLCVGYTMLKNVDLSNLNTGSVTTMYNMFNGCSNLNTLDLSKFDTGNVTNMSCMFYNCSGLTSVDLSDLDTGNVTDMSSMFSECSGLTNVDLSGLDTGNVESMWHMFSGCSSLSSIDLSGLDTGKVTSMGSMFSGCSSLSSIDLSGLDTGKVTDMSCMFSSCSSLSSIDLNGLDTGNVTDMKSMFGGCSSLSSIDLSGLDTGKVTSMGGMFYSCSGLSSVNLSDLDTGKVTSMSSMFYDCSSLISLNLSNFDTGNVTDMSYMFRGCSNLSSLDLSSFNTGDVTNMYSMFEGCSSLDSLDLSNFNTENVTDMGYMFSNCSSLSALNISNFDTRKVTNMERMFYGCSNLSSLDLSGIDTENVTNMHSMFGGCSSLISVDLSNFDTGNVTSMSYMFSGCSSLISVDLSSFDIGKVISMKSMFGACSNLTEILVGSNWTTVGVDTSGMFIGCGTDQVTLIE